MARQTGIIRLKGTIGGVSFYKSADGHLAREKGGVDGNRIKNDPAFQRTRENGQEFGTAGSGAKLLRNANRNLINNAKDRNTSARLTTQMLRVVKSDPVNERGERKVMNGNLDILLGFEFNTRGRLGSTFFGTYNSTFDRATGDASVSVEAFSPINSIAFPGGTTHYKMVSGVSLVDFDNEEMEFDIEETPIQPMSATTVPALTLDTSVTGGSTSPAFIVFGVQFYQEVNGEMYVLNNGSFNALQLVFVDQL